MTRNDTSVTTNDQLTAERDAYRAALTLYANLQVNYRRVITFQMLDEVWESASKATDQYGCADCHGQTFEDGMVCCWTCGREMPQADAAPEASHA